MPKPIVPFNIKLLSLTDKDVNRLMLKPVTSLDIYEGMTKNFNTSGLYSVEIFGQVGTEDRFNKFAYVDIKLPILHPLVYNILIKTKSLYQGILTGKTFAQWDTTLKDFVKCEIGNGETGISFFMKHWKDIVYEQTGSAERAKNIKFLTSLGPEAVTSNIVIIPAAYRDLEVDDSGNETSNDINAIYHKIIAVSKTIYKDAATHNPSAYDNQMISIQNSFVELFEYIDNILSGKKGFIWSKFDARRLFNGTRNVITAMPTHTSMLGSDKSLKFNDSALSLRMFLKGCLPKAKYNIRTRILNLFLPDTPNLPANLVNMKTLRSERTNLNYQTYNKFMSAEGLDAIIEKYSTLENYNKPVILENRYLCLVYLHSGKLTLISGIDHLLEGMSEKDCHPITYIEMFYYAVGILNRKLPAYITRYPSTGIGSTYPSAAYIKTTVDTEIVDILDHVSFEPTGEKLLEWPISTSAVFNSLSVHTSKLSQLGADYDGDMCSCNIAYFKDSVDEFKNYTNELSAYVQPDGTLLNSVENDINIFVMQCLTLPPDSSVSN